MMSRLSKASILGLLTGVVGLIISLSPFGLNLEENVGLDSLFSLRGMRHPPPDVIIVTTDRKSAEKLNLPKEPRKWPRSLHARLIENLVKGGASVIAFDLSFDEARSSEEDNQFAEALSKAGNVVLCEYLKKERIPLSDKKGRPGSSLEIERPVPPIPLLAKSAAALAPFPLPKVPVKVSRYWTFKTEAGDTPTLPVVAFQIFTINAQQEFIGLLDKVTPYRSAKLWHGRERLMASRSLEEVIQEIRSLFENDPSLAEKMLQELQNPAAPSVPPGRIHLLKSLTKMYRSDPSPFLDFYGPPGTITTIPYYQAVQLHAGETLPEKQFDFTGKAVFVGLYESLPSEQKDGFHTVFSDSSGLDISGVEIAATAFANLLEGRSVRPFGFWAHVAMLVLWGVLAGMLSYLLPHFVAGLSALGMAVLYLLLAAYHFKTAGSWYPLVIPLLIQSPLAFFSAVLWKFIDVNKERQNIRKAFRYYLPEKVIDQLAKNVRDPGRSGQLVYGICLHTDAARYTALSETMDPEELGAFMNSYYEVLFKPIKDHGGIVADIVGDSMLALWVTEKPDPAYRSQACHAALDIATAVDQFNQSSGKRRLPTRIGLHSGYVLLGNVGAIDHFEYRPIGDIVNTAARIEGLNKLLGTRILVSEDVIDQLGAFVGRGLGNFLLVGKTKPLCIHELVCRVEESNEQQKDRCMIFAGALDAFRKRAWEEAMEKCEESISCFGEDGPSLFYLRLCKKYRENPPEDSWDGVVCTAEK